MEKHILEELREIRCASNKMLEHIHFVETHITWVQRIMHIFVPKLPKLFKQIEEIPFDNIV